MAEKNINFNEAKTKGLVAPNKIAQEEVLKLAGGESAFRPESWWNEQLTKQVNAKNFQEVSGSKMQVKSTGIAGMMGSGWQDAQIGMGGYQPTSSGIMGQKPREGIDYRYVPTYKDVTLDVLKNITKQSKQALETTKRESGELGATRKRLARVTGGLLAGAQAPSMGAVSSGPMLGSDAGLGSSSTLGRRTRI